LIEPGVEPPAPIIVFEVEALDAEAGHIDRHLLTGAIEHRARQPCAPRSLDALALVDADFIELIEEALVPVAA
jgi:hypothetical protein